MRDGENQTLNMSLSRKCFSADHLPSRPAALLGTVALGILAERWLAEKHEQGNMDGRLCLESVQCGKGYVEISESYIFFSCALHIFRLY